MQRGGDGEYIIQQVLGFRLAALIQYKGISVKEAADHLFRHELKDMEGKMGLIALDTNRTITLQFNSDR